jgi:hypothetical protein
MPEPQSLSDGKATITIVSSVAAEHTITAHYTEVSARFAAPTAEAVFIAEKQERNDCRLTK